MARSEEDHPQTRPEGGRKEPCHANKPPTPFLLKLTPVFLPFCPSFNSHPSLRLHLFFPSLLSSLTLMPLHHIWLLHMYLCTYYKLWTVQRFFFCLFVLVSCLTYANMCHTFNYFCMRFTLQLNLPPTTFAVSTLGLANDGSSFKQKQLIPFHRQTHTHAHKPTKNT